MSARNLGIVFGPTIMRAPDPMTDYQNAALHSILFRLLIENFHVFFTKSSVP